MMVIPVTHCMHLISNNSKYKFANTKRSNLAHQYLNSCSIINCQLKMKFEFFPQFYTMRLMTGMEIVWLQNVQMGQRKRLQRDVHHYRYQCVVCK
jgi:spore maturation protein CgeB